METSEINKGEQKRETNGRKIRELSEDNAINTELNEIHLNSIELETVAPEIKEWSNINLEEMEAAYMGRDNFQKSAGRIRGELNRSVGNNLSNPQKQQNLRPQPFNPIIDLGNIEIKADLDLRGKFKPEMKMRMEEEGYVVLKSNISSKKEISLLVDSGASCSIIQASTLSRNIVIDKNECTHIKGLFGLSQSLGTVQAKLSKGNTWEVDCKFQVIQEANCSPTDGILGRDFLKGRANIDFRDSTLSIKPNERRGEEKLIETLYTRKERASPIELPTMIHQTRYGKGAILLNQMGYKFGQGIGRNLQGRKNPIEATSMNQDRKGLGWIHRTSNSDKDKGGYIKWIKSSVRQERNGTTTPTTYEYKGPMIELPENDITKIEMITPLKGVRKYMVTTEKRTRVELEPQAETMIEINVESKGDMVCKGEEIQAGVYMMNTIIRPEHGKAFIGAINRTFEKMVLENYQPKLESLEDYDVFKGDNQVEELTLGEKGRGNKLKEILQLETTLDAVALESMTQCCQDYADIFQLPGDKLTYTNVKQFHLPLLPGAPIIHKKQYRIPHKHRKELFTQVENLLRNEIIEPSLSPYNSPVLLVPKKGLDGKGNIKYRMCVDYREINKNSQTFSFPLPRIEDIIDQLGKAKFYSTLDLSQGFHQVLIDSKDRGKTAFSTDIGHYQFRRCPFGLKNIPGFFQSLLNGVLTGLQGTQCFVYLDDVVIMAQTVQEHEQKIREIFQRFRTSRLKLNPEKCTFMKKEIMYLGHKCSAAGVKPDERLLLAVKEYPSPRNVRQTQSFLGLANYYRKFVENFTIKAKPLYKLLKKEVKYHWDEQCEVSFQTLKQALTSPPVLAYPDFEREFTITCDASGSGLGAILEQDGRVIMYASRSLRQAEVRWSTTELELNAVVFACRTFRCYILGRRTQVYTDHQPLRGTLKMQEASSRILRLLQKLAEYDLEIIYKKGKENSNADALSRYVPRVVWAEKGRESSDSEDHDTNKIRKIKRRSCQLGCTSCFPTGQMQKSTGRMVDKDTQGESEEFVGVTTRGQVQQKVLKRSEEDTNQRIPDSQEDPVRIEEEVIPEKNKYISNDREVEEISSYINQRQILQEYHDTPMGGHFGAEKTYFSITRKFHWKGMKKDVREYIRNCEICQKTKHSRDTRAPLILVNPSSKPFEKLYIDIVGPLPKTPSGNQYILSMIDDLTRFVEFASLPDQQADTVARTLYEHILFRYNIPKIIVSDNGTNLKGRVMASMCKLLGVRRLYTTAYHPQSDLVERQHRTLGNYLRAFTDKDPSSWDQYLRAAAHAYNNTAHASTRRAPMEMLFGFISEVPTNLKKKPEPIYDVDSYVQELRFKLQTAHAVARDHLANKKIKAKDYYDLRVNDLRLKEGDWVLLKNPTRKSKLDDLWIGPYKVTKLCGPVNVEITKGSKNNLVHINRLKLFHQKPPEVTGLRDGDTSEQEDDIPDTQSTPF